METVSQPEQPIQQTLQAPPSPKPSLHFSKIVLAVIILLVIVITSLGYYLVLGRKGNQHTVITQHPTLSPTISVSSPTSVQNTNITTGISGTIIESPTCPGAPRPGQICERPYQATIFVQSQDQSQTITQFTSDSQGKFKVSLPPGTYVLVPKNNHMPPTTEPQQVTVQQGNITTVTFTFDTGMR